MPNQKSASGAVKTKKATSAKPKKNKSKAAVEEEERQRAVKFSQKEMDTIEIQAYQLRNKINSRHHGEKQLAWSKITAAVNKENQKNRLPDEPVIFRDVKDVKLKFKRMKESAKTKKAAKNKHHIGTGGGPPIKELTQGEEFILATMCKSQYDGIVGGIDTSIVTSAGSKSSGESSKEMIFSPPFTNVEQFESFNTSMDDNDDSVIIQNCTMMETADDVSSLHASSIEMDDACSIRSFSAVDSPDLPQSSQDFIKAVQIAPIINIVHISQSFQDKEIQTDLGEEKATQTDIVDKFALLKNQEDLLHSVQKIVVVQENLVHFTKERNATEKDVLKALVRIGDLFETFLKK